MNQPKISIVIPVYNGENYIRECIDSCIRQTFEQIEIICVNDASTDDTLSILNEYSLKDKRIRVFSHQETKSALGARKTAVMAAQGEYIMFVDADDYISEDACETVYNQMNDSNADILHFPLVVDNKGDVSDKKIKEMSDYSKPYNGWLDKNDVFDYCFIKDIYRHSLCNKAFKSDLCKNAYSKAEDKYMIFAEDLYTYFIIADLAKSYCGWDKKPLYFYCLGRGVTQTNNKYNLTKFEKNCQHAEVIDALNKYCNKYHPNEKKYADVIKRYYDEWIIRSIRILDNHLMDDEKSKATDIIDRYWGKDNVMFMRDKYYYVKMRKSFKTTVIYVLKLLLNKGLLHTVKVIKY